MPSVRSRQRAPCFENVPGKGLRDLGKTHRSAPPQKQRGKSVRSAKQAFDAAQELGPITPVEPAGLGPDGSPRLGRGQVFVMKTGKVFHPAWCSVVGTKWDSDPKGLVVVAEDTVGSRKQCRACDNPLTS
jgi:hypothetical protein